MNEQVLHAHDDEAYTALLVEISHKNGRPTLLCEASVPLWPSPDFPNESDTYLTRKM